MKSAGNCPTRHYVRADAIEQVVKLELQRMAQFLRDDETMFADLLERKSNREIAEEKKRLEGELKKALMRTETVSRLYKKAFEKNAEGLLSDEGFLQITHEYDVEQLALKARSHSSGSKLRRRNGKRPIRTSLSLPSESLCRWTS